WVINYAQSEGGLPATEPVIRRSLKTFSENRLANLEKEASQFQGDLFASVLAILPCFADDWIVSEKAVCTRLEGSRLRDSDVAGLYTAGALCYCDTRGFLMTSRTHSYELVGNYASHIAFERLEESRGLLGARRRHFVEEARALPMNRALTG